MKPGSREPGINQNITAPGFFHNLKVQGIPKIQGLEDAFQIVVPIGPALPHRKVQIDLAGGRYFDSSHRLGIGYNEKRASCKDGERTPPRMAAVTPLRSFAERNSGDKK
jgi:hypothetical protein